jgi:hypothetical protein
MNKNSLYFLTGGLSVVAMYLVGQRLGLFYRDGQAAPPAPAEPPQDGGDTPLANLGGGITPTQWTGNRPTRNPVATSLGNMGSVPVTTIPGATR